MNASTMPATATEAARLVRERLVGPVELTEGVLRRIDALDPEIGAVVELRREEALAEAAVAERTSPSGPLHGVPITIKEAFDVQGMHTTWGLAAFAEAVAESDSEIVRRLKAAGAIVLGTTNVHTMLADFAQTSNEIYGATKNPWDTTMVPGGSSGGSAAAVAAGLTFMDYGSDLVGSIRIPAAFCGVYGLRPSVGVTPSGGFQPPGPRAGSSEMGHALALGPIGRSPADLRLALGATAGPERPTARAYGWRLAPPRHRRLHDYRVGVVLDDPGCPVSADVAGPLRHAVDALARAGVKIVAGWPEGVDPGRAAEAFAYQTGLYLSYVDPGAENFGRAREFIGQERARMASRDAWGRYFEDVDVFLCPVDFTAAFPHDDRPFADRRIETSEGPRRYDEQTFWVAQPALPGLPALAAPVGRGARGLPVGLQIVGPLFEDDTVLTFGELLAEATGGFEAPPIARRS